jgi:hypothetical protein
MWLLDRIIPAPYRWAAAGVVALVLLGVIGLQTVRLANAKADTAELKADWALERATLAATARRATQAMADQRAAHAAQQQENADAYAKQVAARKAAEADAVAARSSVRNAITTYLASGGLSAGANASACGRDRSRSAALGDLLGDVDELAEKLAGAAEQHADEVRLLKRQILIDRAGCAPLI